MPRKKKITINSHQKKKFVPQEKEIVQQQEESLQQLGQKIREARIAKNLSLESVSGHLHIAVKILKAIEEGDAEKGPKPVFLRGLVRTYCNYLGIDKNDVVDKIEQHLKSDATGKQELKTLKPIFEIKESHPIRNIVILMVLIAGGYLLYATYSYQIPFFLTQDNNTQSKSAIVTVEEKLAEYEKRIGDSKSQVNRMIKEANDQAEKNIIKSNEDFHKLIEIRKKSTEEKIKQLMSQAIKDIKNASVNIAFESIEKLLLNSLDKSKLDKIFSQSIEETKLALQKKSS